jgi:hypothetical protein
MVAPKKTTSGRITEKKPVRVERRIPRDPEQAGRVLQLRRRRDELVARIQHEPGLQSDLEGVGADLEDAEDEVRENSIKFVAVSIGKQRWKELKAKYPPTKEQKREAQRDGMSFPFDVDAFPPVAVRECLRISETDENGHETLSELTDDMISDMFDGDDGAWNDAEVADLINAVVFANGTQHQIGDLGNG